VNVDYDRDKIRDISRTDLKLIVLGLVEELHKDCGQKIDDDLLQHTSMKFSSMICGGFSSWYWGDVRRVCLSGITGAYGTRIERITFQTLMTWMKRAQQQRGVNYAEKEIQEAGSMNNLTHTDFINLSGRWREFRKYLESVGLWFVDNISESNCNAFHTASKSGTLNQFKKTLAAESDPEYLEAMKRITLDQFKQTANVQY